MLAIRRISTRERELLVPKLQEAGLAYRLLENIRSPESKPSRENRNALRRFQNLCGRLGHPDIGSHPLDFEKIYCVHCGKECLDSKRTSDFPVRASVFPYVGHRPEVPDWIDIDEPEW